MGGIGQSMIATVDDDEIARLAGAFVQGDAVLEAHHVVGGPLDDQVHGYAARRQRVAPARVLDRERHAQPSPILEIVVGQLGEARRRVPRHDRQPRPPGGHVQGDEAAEARAEQPEAPVDVTRQIVERGYCISVTPEVVYRERDRELVQRVPLDSLLVESDAPWKYAGEFATLPSGPWLTARVAEEIAKIKRLPVEDTMAQLSANTCRVFDLIWA